MATQNTDFLRFSAYSIKDLITRKLSQDSNFTDQIYEGSNLAILIDLVSYMYQCLVYVLNNAAAESMFSDTAIYENMNRLVSLIGYHPKGIIPSTAQFYIDNREKREDDSTGGRYADYLIPRYSYIDTGKIDKNGESVYYSTKVEMNVTDDQEYEFKLYNGKWYYHNPIVADGIQNETFILTTLKSDIANNGLIANDGIHVYVEYNGITQQYDVVDYDLFTDNNINNIKTFSEIYSKNANVCSLRLNEKKEYELKFGDGNIGKQLDKDSIIHILYLKTNGLDGKIDFDTYDNSAKFKDALDDLSIDSNSGLGKIIKTSTFEDDDKPRILLKSVSTDAQAEESVKTIRNIAPQWFKMGNRLITNDDYVYYLKNRYSDNIIDVVCQNNWEYISTFFKWLYQLGKNNHNNPRYYLDQEKLIRNDYLYADSADSNNVYLWTKLYAGDINTLKNTYLEDIENIKSLTTELVFLKPIEVNFALCAAPIDVAKKYFDISPNLFDLDAETYIEITVSDNNIYVTAQIQNLVETEILNYFNINKLKLGMTINYNELLNSLLNINGISRIRTVWISKDDKTASNPIIYNGLCFATWSDSYLDRGDDLEISNSTKTLQVFQVPKLYTKQLARQIKIVKKSINNINTIQY